MTQSADEQLVELAQTFRAALGTGTEWGGAGREWGVGFDGVGWGGVPLGVVWWGRGGGVIW